MARPRVPGARSKHNKFHNVIAGTVVLAVLLGTLSFVPRGLQIQRSHALGESGLADAELPTEKAPPADEEPVVVEVPPVKEEESTEDEKNRPALTVDTVASTGGHPGAPPLTTVSSEPWMAQPAPDAGIPGLVAPAGSDKYHVIVSTNQGTYTQWQSRVCYYWYRKMKALYPDSAMGGFTRLLHSGHPDELMEEIPTVVVDPMPPWVAEIARGYVVLERPLAFQQWIRKYAHTIPEPYILMGEPDHIFILPPPLWATPTSPAAYNFFYIEPKQNEKIINKFNPNNVPIDQFDPIGNSPVMIHKDQFASFVDLWVNTSLAIKQDKEADKEFGWVQEMYAYSIASATAAGGPIRHQLKTQFMAQPPWDDRPTREDGEHIYIIHFTYGNDFDVEGKFTPGKVGAWHFDKRDYMVYYPSSNFPQPARKCNNTMVRRLISSITEAAHSLSDWEAHTQKAEETR